VTHTHDLKPGDRVAYSRAFLRAIGCYTGSLPFARGRVRAIAPRVQRFTGDKAGPYVVTIDWPNHLGLPDKVLSSNLVRVADISRELA
jgi:hypothetical protein